MLNPYTRVLELCDTSEGAFRKEYGFAKQTLVDVTAGCFENLSERMVISLGKLCWEKNVVPRTMFRTEYQSETLEEAYQFWRQHERNHNRYLFLLPPEHWTRDTSPARSYVSRTAGTPTAFSKKLLVPPQTVRRWVNGVNRHTPLSIEKALRSISYPYLRELVAAQAAWYDENRS